MASVNKLLATNSYLPDYGWKPIKNVAEKLEKKPMLRKNLALLERISYLARG